MTVATAARTDNYYRVHPTAGIILSLAQVLELGERLGDERIIQLGQHGGQWKHGWIPLNAIAMEIAARRGIRHGGGAPSAPRTPRVQGKRRMDVEGAVAQHAAGLGGSRPKGQAPTRQAAAHDVQAAAAEAVRLKAPELKARAARGDKIAAAELKRRETKRAAKLAPAPAGDAAHPSGWRVEKRNDGYAVINDRGDVVSAHATRASAQNALNTAAPRDRSAATERAQQMAQDRHRNLEAQRVQADELDPTHIEALSHADLAAALKAAPAGSQQYAALRTEAEKRVKAAQAAGIIPAAPAAPAKARRKPSQLHVDWQAAKLEQRDRHENYGKVDRSTSTPSADEYFGEGEYAGKGAVEKRLTYAQFLANRRAGKEEDRRQQAAYDEGVKLGAKHAGENDTSSHDAEYQRVSQGHDDQTFGYGYNDGIIASEHKAKTPTGSSSRADNYTGGSYAAPAMNAIREGRTGSARERMDAANAQAVAKQEGAAKIDQTRAIAEQHREANTPTLELRRTRDAAPEGSPERLGAERELDRRKSDHVTVAADTRRRGSAAVRDTTNLERLPLGSTVTARQPGIENPTHGVVAKHEGGMVHVAYKDRHDNTVTGIFPASHVTPRAGEQTPEHRGAPETRAFVAAAEAHPFHPGDKVLNSSGQKLTVTAVDGDKVSVRFPSGISAQVSAGSLKPGKVTLTGNQKINLTTGKVTEGASSTRHDIGNNESISTGISEHSGVFTALTHGQSKTFKTRAGAERWLSGRGYNPDGTRGGETPEQVAARIGMTFPKPTVKGHAVIGEGATVESGTSATVTKLLPHGYDVVVHHNGQDYRRSGAGAFYTQPAKGKGEMVESPTLHRRLEGAHFAALERRRASEADTGSARAFGEAARATSPVDIGAEQAKARDLEAKRKPPVQGEMFGGHGEQQPDMFGPDTSPDTSGPDTSQRATSGAGAAVGATERQASEHSNAVAALQRNHLRIGDVVEHTGDAMGNRKGRADTKWVITGTSRNGYARVTDTGNQSTVDMHPSEMRKVASPRNAAPPPDATAQPAGPVLAGSESAFGKHNVKPGDVAMVNGRPAVVHSTGPKKVKLMTEVGPLPYAYTQIQKMGKLDDSSTDALKRLLRRNTELEGFGAGTTRRLPPAVIDRIRAILKARGEEI